MAKSRDNVVMYGMSGTIGRMLVFRRRGDQMIVARRPKKNDKPLSDDQVMVQERFREAALYAKTAIKDPLKKAAYQEAATENQSAFNVAFADYLHAPVINPDYLITDSYTGTAGDLISIRATDDFKVTSVTVKIYDTANALIESGEAVLKENGLDWIYTATASNAAPAGSKIKVQAADLPGNTSTLEVTV